MPTQVFMKPAARLNPKPVGYVIPAAAARLNPKRVGYVMPAAAQGQP